MSLYLLNLRTQEWSIANRLWTLNYSSLCVCMSLQYILTFVFTAVYGWNKVQIRPVFLLHMLLTIFVCTKVLVTDVCVFVLAIQVLVLILALWARLLQTVVFTIFKLWTIKWAWACKDYDCLPQFKDEHYMYELIVIVILRFFTAKKNGVAGNSLCMSAKSKQTKQNREIGRVKLVSGSDSDRTSDSYSGDGV